MFHLVDVTRSGENATTTMPDTTTMVTTTVPATTFGPCCLGDDWERSLDGEVCLW